MQGLTKQEVLNRIENKQTNTAKNENNKTIFDIIWTNVFSFFNILTFGLAIWLWRLEAYFQTFFIGVTLINITVSIVQEIKAKKTLEKLAIVVKEKATVIRDGIMQEIEQNEIVLDDIIYYKVGQQISVDGILLKGTMACDESLLTGESNHINKLINDTVLSGSYVTRGSGYVKATKVGNSTYAYKLTKEAKRYQKPKSEIFNSLNILIRSIGILIIPLGTALLLLSLKNNSFRDASIQTVAALIGMIPSGLFLLTTTALAVSVLKLSKVNTLVQDLYCIEMLARIDLICLDKTGTLTDGNLSLNSIITKNDDDNNLLSFYVHNVTDDSNMIKILRNNLIKSTTDQLIIQRETPFSSEYKYSELIISNDSYKLGAPDMILKSDYSNYSSEIVNWIDLGYRVILFTKNEVPLSYILFEDTIRETAFETINYFQENDVSVKIITGDFSKTASLIAKKVGMNDALSAIDINNLTDDELADSALHYTVFGRANPLQKQKLIQIFKNHGHKVAMTGDGINDILALKEADTSVAMASGSQAARNVSHLVLLDNDFSHMPDIVFEGRRVINNIEKVAALFLTKTAFSILLSIFSLFYFDKYPFIPIQLTLISLFTIGIPSFILAFKPNKNRIKQGFLTSVLKRAIPTSILILISHIIIQSLSLNTIISLTETTSLKFYITAFILIYLLIEISRPLTLFNILLVITMFGGIILFPIIFKTYVDLLSIFSLSSNSIYVILFSLIIYLLYVFIRKLLKEKKSLS